MLERISIKNIALISDLSIDLSSGFNVLTGETGAGKSLVIDSISLMLGERADKGLISHGKEFASVEAVFSTQNQKVLNFLEEVGLEKENTIIIYRKIFADGRNECRVNGKSFTLSMLKRLTSFLVDLHGQFEHQSLLKVSNHVEILDDFAGLSKTKNKLEKEIEQINSIQNKMDSFVEDDKERERSIDLLKFQIDEITDAAFEEGEEEKLKEKLAILSNQEKIKTALSETTGFLSFGEESSVLENLNKAITLLGSISHLDSKFEKERQRLSSIKYDAEDVFETLIQIMENFESETDDFESVDKRLDLLKLFKKKYGDSIEKINAFLEKAKERFDFLKNAEIEVEKLKKEKQAHVDSAEKLCTELSEKRKVAALIFEKKVIEQMNDLGMKNAKFVVSFSKKSSITKNGFDEVEFLLSVNTGVPERPLSKIASGGEMSRFMLAVKNIIADTDEISTMIFDEIDTGISGIIGRVVGEKLVSISLNHQVVCVTHLAQIAVHADTQFKISKVVKNDKAETLVEVLDGEKRVDEIERLVGGFETGVHAKLHAKELLEKAKQFKKN